MKVVIAHYKYYIQGGPERYMFKFIELLQRKGHVAIPFSVKSNDNATTKYDKYFVTDINIESNPTQNKKLCTPVAALKGIGRLFHNREAYRNMKRLIHDEHPDLLYILIPGSLSPDIIQAAKEEHIPVIMRLSDYRYICGSNVLLRGETVCEECIYGQYRHMVEHKCVHNSKVLSVLRMLELFNYKKHGAFQKVDAVICPPEFTAEKYIASGYFPKEKVHINPTFVDSNAFEPCYENKGYVLCLGRFSPEKGYIYALEAMRYLKDIPVKIYITGTEEECAESILKVIAEYDIRNKVEFIGFQSGESLKHITREAMCVACPSICYENLPNVILEAFAYGKPVIASDIGSLSDMVQDGVNGFLCEPKNAEQIANCVRKLYCDSTLCREMGIKARKKAETEYSPEQHWSKFIEIYSSIK